MDLNLSPNPKPMNGRILDEAISLSFSAFIYKWANEVYFLGFWGVPAENVSNSTVHGTQLML